MFIKGKERSEEKNVGREKDRKTDRMKNSRAVMNYFAIKKVSIRGCLITKLDERLAKSASEVKSDVI